MTMILRIGNRETSYKNRTGFSLIELMVTVAVLSIGLVFVLHAFSTTVKASRLAIDMNEACFLAGSIISDLEMKQNNSEILSQESSETDRFRWSYELTPLEDTGISTLNFKVSGIDTKSKDILEVVTYLNSAE